MPGLLYRTLLTTSVLLLLFFLTRLLEIHKRQCRGKPNDHRYNCNENIRSVSNKLLKHISCCLNSKV